MMLPTLARSFSPVAGQRGGSSKDEVLHKALEEGKKLGISERTTHRVRAKMRRGPKPRTKKRTDCSATGAATSHGSARETSMPSPTAAALSKKTQALQEEVDELSIVRSKGGPAG